MNADAAVARRLAAGLHFLKTGGQRPPLQLEVTPASCWLCSAAILAALEKTMPAKLVLNRFAPLRIALSEAKRLTVNSVKECRRYKSFIFNMGFLLEEQSHRKKFAKLAKNAGSSKETRKKEIPFCLWKSLQSIENKQSLEEQTQANPLFKPAISK